MYTTQPCSAPSGSTIVPQSVLAQVQQLATSAIQNGSDCFSAMMQVEQVIARSGIRDANSSALLRQAALSACKQAVANNQVGRANLGWLRLLGRQPADFSGMRIPLQEFGVPQAPVLHTLVNPVANAYDSAEYIEGKRNGATCNPPDDAPEVIPINGGFSYYPGQAQLQTGPMQPVPRITDDSPRAVTADDPTGINTDGLYGTGMGAYRRAL